MLLSPITTKFLAGAEVMATFMRRISARKPIRLSALLRVMLMYTMSRSCPWKLSMVLTVM